MAARLIRAGDLVRRPWKNGGGTTAEVLAEPAEAGFDGFVWRVSMADVATDGPFSTFAGIDRTLVLIEGETIELDIDGVTRVLDAASPFVGFSGEARTKARLPAGPIRDLNVMTRRGRAAHALGLWDAPREAALSSIETCLVVGLGAAAMVTVASRSYDLDRLDVLAAESESSVALARGSAIVIVITPHAP